MRKISFRDKTMNDEFYAQCVTLKDSFNYELKLVFARRGEVKSWYLVHNRYRVCYVTFFFLTNVTLLYPMTLFACTNPSTKQQFLD